MPKPNSEWDNVQLTEATTLSSRRSDIHHVLSVVCCLLMAGCATSQYAVRPSPVPEETASAHQIEQTISAVQANEFLQKGAHLIRPDEIVRRLPVQSIVDRLSHVTERPSLHYRAYLYTANDPNAAALADGRIFISSGMLSYLASRGSRQDELAFVLAHELAHTVAQHLVKRYRTLQQQQLLMTLVSTGAAVVTQNAGIGVQTAGRLAVDIASLLNNVAISGYSQSQESEADQLGIRYVMRAGFNPRAALDLLQDFERFDSPIPFLRTHPYVAQRREDLRRYLADVGALHAPAPTRTVAPPIDTERLRELRETQKLYPIGSVSWKNLQQQIESLEDRK